MQDGQKVWDMYFMAVCSIRFHPANNVLTPNGVRRECEFAAAIVEEMLRCRLSRLQSSAAQH